MILPKSQREYHSYRQIHHLRGVRNYTTKSRGAYRSMAMTNTPQPSTGGVTSTIWKGTCILSAKSLPYPHFKPGGDVFGMANGARIRLVSGGDITLTNHTDIAIE